MYAINLNKCGNHSSSYNSTMISLNFETLKIHGNQWLLEISQKDEDICLKVNQGGAVHQYKVLGLLQQIEAQNRRIDEIEKRLNMVLAEVHPVEEAHPVEEPPIVKPHPVEELPIDKPHPIEEPPIEEAHPVEEPHPVEDPQGDNQDIVDQEDHISTDVSINKSPPDPDEGGKNKKAKKRTKSPVNVSK